MRLLALDVDGTILTSAGKIQRGLRDALLGLSDDIRVVIATGRRLSNLEPVLEELDYEMTTVVVLNGGLTVDLAAGRVLAAHTLGVDLEEAYEHGIETGLLLGAVYPSADHADLHGSEGLGRIGTPGYAGPLTRPIQEACYLAAWGRKPEIDTWAESVDATGVVRVYVYPEGPGWYHAEVTPKGIDKQVAVSGLARMLGCSRRDVIACGDGGNDTTLLGWAGTGVAMGNAPGEIRDVADRVIGTSDEGALTAFLLELGRASEAPFWTGTA